MIHFRVISFVILILFYEGVGIKILMMPFIYKPSTFYLRKTKIEHLIPLFFRILHFATVDCDVVHE